MDALRQDLRYAARTFRQAPGFTCIAMVTLALGIAANVTVFSFANAVYLRPLPYPAPEELVRVLREDTRRGGLGRISLRAVQDWKRDVKVFDDVAAYAVQHRVWTGVETPKRLLGCVATYNLLSTLGADVSLGRGFLPEDDRPGGERLAILSDALWRTRFGADPGAVGSIIQLDGEAHTVVGVLSAAFVFFGRSEPEVYTLYRVGGEPWHADYESRAATGLARVRSGTAPERAEAALSRFSERRAESDEVHKYRVQSLHEVLLPSRRIRLGLPILSVVVGFVFLIACANVANLLFARGRARGRELALRTALGASSRRVVRQLLTEGLVLAILGGVLGLVLAHVGVRWIVSATPVENTRLFRPELDGAVLLFVSASIGLATLLSALVPAIRAASAQVIQALKSDWGRTPGSGRARGALVVVQLILTCILLIASAVLIRSVVALNTRDLGFSPEGILTMGIAPPPNKYPEPTELIRFYARLEASLGSIPGVRAVGSTNNLTLTGADSRGPVELSGHAVDAQPDVSLRSVSTGYFAALSARMRVGRSFSPTDAAESPLVAIVNEVAVRRWFPDVDPIGQRLVVWDGSAREVVGVVEDFYEVRVDLPIEPVVYLPAAQAPVRNRSMAILVSGEPSAARELVEDAVGRVDPDQPIHLTAPMTEWVSRQAWAFKMMTTVLVVFAGVALMMASAGVYGLSFYAVVERTREIGVRMALGARAADTVRMFLSEALRRTVVALAVGLTLSFFAVAVLERLLVAVDETGYPVFATVASILAAVTLFATGLPAVRATKLDPAIALRNES